ncbi:hypothetical protein KR093_010218 [Drosophila rubida]|uniref:Dynein assembly factor 5, axonemal n=1 Tax=Drosophila rubida TaxID=30044 RepID=A0AAD4JUN6_9MUSC|nr:hypothetical protein KR093_010218 [Drosophila rubida]
MNYDLDTKQICGELESSEHRRRNNALQRLCEQVEQAPETVSSDAIAADFDELYLHLLKCYDDRFESVRDHAVLAVNAFLERLPPSDFHLLNVVATLADRMGQPETVEPSEEIRLRYVQQLHLMLRKYARMGNVGVFRECYPQVVKVLVKSIRDEYAAVQREGCATLVQLARVADTQELRPFTEQLAIALYTMLNHRHSAARIAAIEALGRVCLHMDASGEGMRRLFMEVSPLLMDSMPLVRRACGELGVLLLLELPDRYSYFERILPLVLCCLKDDSPEVLRFIRPLWVKCGEQYYEENEAELSQQEICDPQVDNYPSDVQRPTIGCRGLVQRSLRLLQLITRETGDWKENVRLHSLKLLYQFVLHAESAMTAKFFEIYGQLAQVCCDSEYAVREEAAKVADLLGRLLAYNAWIEHGFEGLERNAREPYLRCFYHMFNAANGGTYDQLLRLCKLLRSTDYSHTLKEHFQRFILKTLYTVLVKSRRLTAPMEDIHALYEVFYVIATKVTALAFSRTDTCNGEVKYGKEIIDLLAEVMDIKPEMLHVRWFALALLDVQNLDTALDETAEPVQLLYGLVHIAGIRTTYLPQLIAMLKLVFGHCSDSAQVHVFSAVSLAALNWGDTVWAEREQGTQLLSNFVNEIVEPHLVWKAGASGEAMRSMAMATLCALAQHAGDVVLEVLPAYAKHMPSLLEDRNVTTRHYAAKTMIYFRGMSVEVLKPLAYATMQRLDDPSAGIRVIAARSLGIMRPEFKSQATDAGDGEGEGEGEYEREVWEAFVKRAMDLLLLHLESPEAEMKHAARDSLTQLAKQHPAAWQERYERALTLAHNQDVLAELYAQLSIADGPKTATE